jgi:hypothetical protein
MRNDTLPKVGLDEFELTSLRKLLFKSVLDVAMTSKVILDNISVKNNPALFQENMQLEITFTAL